MLKIIRNNLESIKYYEEKCEGCSRSSCESAAQSKIDEAETERAAAEAMETKFDEAIKNIETQRQNIESIGEEYTAFAHELNGAWQGYRDLNGYDTIIADRDCLRQYNEALGSAIVDLRQKKTEWTDKKNEWQTKKTAAENEKAACAGCPCA